MVIVEIANKSIKSFGITNDDNKNGAELVFNGRVRGTEKGKQIKYLEYEYYEGMAEAELKHLANKVCKKFTINHLYCRHRVGKVKAGELSIHIMILSKHRKEAIKAMDWFIFELKKNVPIWKWAILNDGRKIPSDCMH
ncbi:molybdenum cofactor biosynthesis protein MoaE [Candidatus Marinimicrobia bacterium]|nr:molybdenum cofactor biosynthesis protein MoaE [Candidatus Neomarinimicrobiota bacterium]